MSDDREAAVLLVGDWQTACSNCGKVCDPAETHHTTVLGYKRGRCWVRCAVRRDAAQPVRTHRPRNEALRIHRRPSPRPAARYRKHRAMSALHDPRVKVDSYLVYPTGYDEFVNSDKGAWCLSVTNGHAWGWSIRRGMSVGGAAMNRKGQWIYESRGSERNKVRRFPLDEALRIALANVDTHRINGHTAAEASDSVAARLAANR